MQLSSLPLNLTVVCLALAGAFAVARASAAAPFFAGADISMLPELEKAGAVYHDQDGKPADAIKVFRDSGVNLFRLRLFVNPTHDFNKSWGATQDLDQVRALAKRVKSSGARFLLDLHYSDTWADPGKQGKPAAWKDLSFDDLQKQVHDYTASVLRDFKDAGAMPDMVQVGNEIAPGMLWPDGKVIHNGPEQQQDESWQKFAKLFDAGAKAVREASTSDHPIRVVLHIHGGGHQGLPKWFFGKFTRYSNDFDVIGLSYYPGPKENFDDLRQNLRDVIDGWGKDVLIAEVAYPYRETDDAPDPNRKWPLTREGQAQFVKELLDAVRAAPNGRVIGVAWWYPEAMPVKGLGIWKQGANGLFDEQGNPLPALKVFGAAAR